MGSGKVHYRMNELKAELSVQLHLFKAGSNSYNLGILNDNLPPHNFFSLILIFGLFQNFPS